MDTHTTSKGESLGFNLLLLAVLLPGYVLCGMYWFGTISWAPWHLVYPDPGPLTVFNVIGPIVAGGTWIMPGAVVSMLILALLGRLPDPNYQAQSE